MEREHINETPYDNLVKAPNRTRLIDDVDTCTNAIIEKIGNNVILGLPLGLGKANKIANSLFEVALAEPEFSLKIFTALTLEVPSASNGLQRRFLKPLNDRLYHNTVELLYAAARRNNELPNNVEVAEFFLQPGAFLNNPTAQQHYVSSNYTHVPRDLLNRGVNVIAQMVAPHPTDPTRVSLSCNTDIILDLLTEIDADYRNKLLLVAEVNPQLPFLPNDADVSIDLFDIILTDKGEGYSLFSVPQEPITFVDYAIGLHAASYVKDGGTLQIGIGSLGDAVVHALLLRQQSNDVFKIAINALNKGKNVDFHRISPSETGQFKRGLYASSEMFVEGFLDLHEAGVLRRKVHCNAGNQKMLHTDQEDDRVKLINEDSDDTFQEIESNASLNNCVYLHAGFYLGSARFYQRLRDLSDDVRNGINMTGINFVNSLYGHQELKLAQRQHASFINSAMMVTLTGAVISDGLSNNRVVSGVGGQYNFVAQAFALSDSHSVIGLSSTRMEAGVRKTNIVWEYPHTTIPRHLRDVVITEYGAVDLRGKSDRDVIAALLSITDSQFQARLLDEAKKAGKIEADYVIPDCFCNNYPEYIQQVFTNPDLIVRFPHYPLGTDLTVQEAVLAVAFRYLKQRAEKLYEHLKILAVGWWQRKSLATIYKLELGRLNLHNPTTIKERYCRLLVMGALKLAVDPDRPLGNPPGN